MNILRQFHGHFASLTKGLFYWFMESVDDVLQDFQDQITLKSRIYAISTSVGADLDRWGIDLDVERDEGESDANYRIRLKNALQGKGVTKGSLEEIVNVFLSSLDFNDCNILEWFDAGVDLPGGWFEVGIERPAQVGFWMNYSHIGFAASSRHPRECHMADSEFTVRRLGLPALRALIDRWKASGIQYILKLGGQIYEK